MYVAIDIGSYKTVIYSMGPSGTSADSKIGKHEFQTVMSLTTPKRFYGKNVSGETSRDILVRKRGFFRDIKSGEAQKHILMYLNYLAQVVGNDYVLCVLVIPEYFGEEEKSILQGLASISKLRVQGFITNVTGIAACAALRDANCPEKFMVFDFGHHKSAIGVFEYKEKCLVPIARASIRKGAIDFDKVLADILIKKHGLKDDEVIREKLFVAADKIKRGLNELDTVTSSIFVDDDLNKQVLEISKEEYLGATSSVKEEIRAFVADFVGKHGCGDRVEVVGNNYNSCIIKEVMQDIKHTTILHPSMSAAIGAAMAFAVNEKQSDYSVKEMLGRTMTVRLSEKGATRTTKKATTVFAENAHQDSPVTIKYSRTKSFALTLAEDGLDVGVINIEKDETKEPESVKIKLRINNYGLVEVLGVTAQSKTDSEEPRPLSYTLDHFHTLDETKLATAKSFDDEFTAVENAYTATSELRHAVEANMDVLVSTIDNNFSGMLSSDEKNTVEDLIDGYFGTIGKNYDEEVKIKQKLYEDLKFLEDRLSAKEAEIREEIDKMLADLQAVAVNNCKTASDFEIYRAKFALISFNGALSLSLDNFTKFELSAYRNLTNTVKGALAKKYAEIACQAQEAEAKGKQEGSCCDAKNCCSGKDCCSEDPCEASDNCGCQKDASVANDKHGCCGDNGCCSDKHGCADDNCCDAGKSSI